jgi:hypothetical protein
MFIELAILLNTPEPSGAYCEIAPQISLLTELWVG